MDAVYRNHHRHVCTRQKHPFSNLAASTMVVTVFGSASHYKRSIGRDKGFVVDTFGSIRRKPSANISKGIACIVASTRRGAFISTASTDSRRSVPRPCGSVGRRRTSNLWYISVWIDMVSWRVEIWYILLILIFYAARTNTALILVSQCIRDGTTAARVQPVCATMLLVQPAAGSRATPGHSDKAEFLPK